MQDTLLKRALVANACFSTISAVGILLFTVELSVLFADVPPIILQSLAIGLFLFAGFVAWVANKSPIDCHCAKLVTHADWGWVAGSAVLLVFTYDILSIYAIDLVAGIALAVAGFAIAQGKGLKRLANNAGDASFKAS